MMMRLSAKAHLVAALALLVPGVAADLREGCAAAVGLTPKAEEQCQVEDETSLLSLSSQVHVRAAKQRRAQKADAPVVAAKAGEEVDPIHEVLPDHLFVQRMPEVAAPKFRSTLDAVPALLAERKPDMPLVALLLAAFFFFLAAVLIFITCFGLMVERLWVAREAAKAAQMSAPAGGLGASLLLQGGCSSYGTVEPERLLNKDEHLIAVDSSFLMRVLNFTTGKTSLKDCIKGKAALPEDDESSDAGSECPRPALYGVDEEEPESEAEFFPAEVNAAEGEADAVEILPTRSCR